MVIVIVIVIRKSNCDSKRESYYYWDSARLCLMELVPRHTFANGTSTKQVIALFVFGVLKNITLSDNVDY